MTHEPSVIPPWQTAAAPTSSRERLTVSGVLLGSIALVVVLAAISVRSRLVFGLVVLAVIFIPLERLFALRPQRILRAGWRTDLVHFFVNSVALTILLFAVVAVVGTVLRHLVPPGVRLAVASQPPGLQIIEALVLAELGGYVGHRAAHEIPVLWRFHKVHHSITEMDWLASNHLHPIDQTFIRSCAVLPIYVLGFTKASLGVFVVLLTFFAIFIHSNVRFTFGPLRWVLSTPEFHHWHHANMKEAYNSNYAGLFPVIDKLFGTLYLPVGRRPVSYGVPDVQPKGYLRQLAWPFRRTVARPDLSSRRAR
jgi:sterol desaturase/sphingolipid hydroxylase (fatty acid hydroxylase superfamily)